MPQINEILTTGTGTEGSLLIEKKIYDTLIGAVQKNLIPRDQIATYVAPSGISGSSVDIDYETADSLAVREIAEGAAVPIDVVEYTSQNYKPKKYGVRPLITKEMQEDGKFDLLMQNVERAGKEIAENETALIISDGLDNAANTISGGAAITIANLTRGMQYLEDSDFVPTTLFVGPEVANDLRNIDTFVEADKLGSTEMRMNGFIGKIFGMDVIRVSGNLITSTTAYIIDKAEAIVLVEKRPVTVEQYDDVTHDMSGAVITQRLKVGYRRSSAICKITTS
jgi:HK97 family phage major capsid protein